jgi:hypothetical protein
MSLKEKAGGFFGLFGGGGGQKENAKPNVPPPR